MGLGPDPHALTLLLQFCGDTIAGLSLLSASVMRLVHTQEPGHWLELLLEPGSLYILRLALTPAHGFQHLLSPAWQTSSVPPRRELPSPHTPFPPRRDSVRYDFSHEILRDEESFFGERRIPRSRRISVICRSLPEGPGPGEPPQPPPAC